MSDKKNPSGYPSELFVAIMVWQAVLLVLFVLLWARYSVHPLLTITGTLVTLVLMLMSLILHRTVGRMLQEMGDQISTRDLQLKEAMARLDELYLLVSTSHADVLPRKPFLRLMKRELGRAGRIGTPLTVLAIRLRGINAEGVGRVLRMTGRSTDYVGRDGDVFYFLLLDTDREGAEVFISRLAGRLAEEYGITEDMLVTGRAQFVSGKNSDPRDVPSPEKLMEEALENLNSQTTSNEEK